MSGPGAVLRPGSTIAEAPADAQPRERLLAGGARALSDAELLAVVLRNGCPGVSALTLAGKLLDKAGGLAGLAGACERRLRSNGVGRAKVATVLAAVELACRIAASRVPEREVMSRPGSIARYLDLRYGRRGQEVMAALYCDTRHRLIAERELFRGTLHRAAVEPRKVIREGVLCDAAGVVLWHTHPSVAPRGAQGESHRVDGFIRSR